MKIDNPYQTFSICDGTIHPGMFPTDKWFAAISKHIDWKDKTLLDLGCNHFAYLKAGAKSVLGVDNNPKNVLPADFAITSHGFKDKATFVVADINKGIPREKYDVILFSMIMHHFEDAKQTIDLMYDSCNQYMVFVYRLPKPGHPEHGWRPTVQELTEFIAMPMVASEKVMDTDPQQVQMVIYDKNLQ